MTNQLTLRQQVRFRVHQWINTETLEPMFGIQASKEPRKWRHLSDHGVALIFDTKDEALAKVKYLADHFKGEKS